MARPVRRQSGPFKVAPCCADPLADTKPFTSQRNTQYGNRRTQPGPQGGIAALVGTTLGVTTSSSTARRAVLNSQFFPNADPTVGTLAAASTYAVGFLARPLGGIVLGNMERQKLGRRRC